ncbi:protein DBF4 homolog A [Aplochiton taeniatus]
MKPRRIQKSNKPCLKDSKAAQNKHQSTKNQAKPTCGSFSSEKKPLIGRLFYLDLPCNRRTDALENDIKQLGGIVEKFFSKDIKYLVSNKREARYVQCLGRDSPVPSPDSGHSSPQPHPRSINDSLKGSSLGQANTVVTSRGRSLVERVVKEQERIQINKILSNALEWGVKILYIDDVLAYIEKKKNATTQCNVTTVKKNVKAESVRRPAFQKCKGGRISKPFVKIEDSSRHYCPIYLAMPNVPEFNLKSAPPCSPFHVEDKDPNGKKQREQRNRGVKVSASEERGQGRIRKNRDKKRAGYCECCMLKYENIRTHLQSGSHKAFSRSDEYLVLDKLVSTLPFNFTPIKTQTKRPKCSIVSSILHAPGPYVKTEERFQGCFDSGEAEEGQLTLWATAEELETKQIGEPPTDHFQTDAAVSRSNGDQRDGDTVLHQRSPRARSYHRKRVRRQGLPPGTEIEAETAPSRGDASSCISDRKLVVRHCQGDQEGRGPSMDKQPSSKDRREDPERVIPSKVPDATSGLLKAPLASGKLEDLRLEGIVHNQSLEPGNVSCGPDCKGCDSVAHGPPPLQLLQRRVRDFRRKRRKVNGKPSPRPESSLLNLWELFQSSEDMDLEFRGFKDLTGCS